MPTATVPPATNDETVAPRQCGRCRLEFDGDPTLPAGTKPDWWLCPPCRSALLGSPATGATHEVVR